MDLMKLIEFQDFCYRCEHLDIPDTEDPCNECLTYQARYQNSFPLNFVEAEVKKNNSQK